MGKFGLVAWACVAAIGLAGCGGGGGGSTAAPGSTTGGSATTESVVTSGGSTSNNNTSSGGSGSGTSGTTQPTAPAPPVVVTDAVDMAASWVPTASNIIATFDTDTDKAANWTFYPGSEFPGANGGLAEITNGVAGTKAVSLQYDLGCGTPTYGLANTSCGRYVSASLRLPQTIEVGVNDQPTISLDLRNLQGVARPSLRVVDGSGQTLQFPIPLRTLEQASGTAWRSVQIPVGRSSVFWEGTNDGIFRGPLKSVSVLSGDLPMSYPAGSLDIDNVALLKSPDNTFELKSNVPLSNIAFPPTYVGRVGVTIQSYTLAALDKLKAAGITMVRKDLHWDGVEKDGVFSFARYDALTAALTQRDMSVLWILNYGHPDHGGAAPLTSADQSAFAEFARRAALQYKNQKVVGYEIWNEPNKEKRWPSPDPVAFANLLDKAARAIHLAVPTAKVASGGIADLDTTYLLRMLNTGKLTGVDAVGVHPYRKTAPETYAADATPLQNLVNSKGTAAVLWDTEWGYSSFEDIDAAVYGNGRDPRALRRQGILVLRKVLTQIALNSPVSVLYNLLDDGSSPTDREHNFGLLTASGADKPAMVGLRNLYGAQNGRVLKGFIPDVPPGLHVLRWDGASDRAFALWSDTNASKITVQLPATIRTVTRWDGTTVQPTVTSTGRHVVMREADGPLFVTMAK
ncbi:MAG: cellulase family glycosylhydrolase [Aquabacterium sp.]|uniref:cellulase family glycosylhydrolase n=1 Tax=Aquabacterium sp. TaxID=1872578 RepID=UPI00271F519C|nr:cellulase family glycosylhydrolase [Aquabacterium sp.]MDO9002641.1 cellulase family glycosylhydrolase [Aquabacterium sp.]